MTTQRGATHQEASEPRLSASTPRGAVRFEDSPELFGGGCGSGSYAEEKCDVCEAVHNEGCGASEDDDDLSEDSVSWTDFGPLHVCECCFEIIENAVFARMGDIVPWYGRILASQRDALERRERALKEIL